MIITDLKKDIFKIIYITQGGNCDPRGQVAILLPSYMLKWLLM
jgi:hypothetical protein